MNIGHSIGLVRKAQGISQRQIAESIGSSVGSLSLIENGKRNVSLEKLEHIADGLSVPVILLIIIGMDEKDKDSIPEILMSALSAWALDVLSKLAIDIDLDNV